eukprot:g70164.t1
MLTRTASRAYPCNPHCAFPCAQQAVAHAIAPFRTLSWLLCRRSGPVVPKTSEARLRHCPHLSVPALLLRAKPTDLCAQGGHAAHARSFSDRPDAQLREDPGLAKTYSHTRHRVPEPASWVGETPPYPRKLSHRLNLPLRRVVCFQKLSTYQQALREKKIMASALMEDGRLERVFRGEHAPQGQPHTVADEILADANVLRGEKENAEAIELVQRVLKSYPELEVRFLESIDQSDIRWADLVISVGGDGTFLKVAREFGDLVNAPLLGVNSCPSFSFGFFCATDGADFKDMLEKIMAGRLETGELWRLELLINGVPVKPYVLNDVLLTHKIAAATCRYQLTNEGVIASQRSSGIWISTSAGSTGALLNAGGQVFPLTDGRLQYRVRELNFVHRRQEPRLLGGVVANDFCIVSKMQHGMLHLDGNWTGIKLDFNDVVSVRRVRVPLLWFPSKKEILNQATRTMQFRMGGVF